MLSEDSAPEVRPAQKVSPRLFAEGAMRSEPIPDPSGAQKPRAKLARGRSQTWGGKGAPTSQHKTQALAELGRMASIDSGGSRGSGGGRTDGLAAVGTEQGSSIAIRRVQPLVIYR